MTDETNIPNNAPEGPDSSGRPPGTPGDLDEGAALDRLRALSFAAAGEDPEPPPAAPRRQYAAAPSSVRTRRPPAAAHTSSRSVARIAAPAVFLAAVIVLVVLLFQSGMIGGGPEVVVTPSPKASAAKTGAATTKKDGTRVYVVKSGDTLSGIAVKFDTTVNAVEKLNPNKNLNTLTTGAKINIPPK